MSISASSAVAAAAYPCPPPPRSLVILPTSSSPHLLLFPTTKAKTHLFSSTLLPKSKKKGSGRPAGPVPVRCGALPPLADLAPAPATSAAYGSLLLGGGLFAYARSGSVGSIVGGLSGAALMAAAYYLMQTPETKVIGDALGFGSAFLFSAVFGIRLAATRKLIPAGPLLGLSVGSLAVFVSAYMQDKI